MYKSCSHHRSFHAGSAHPNKPTLVVMCRRTKRACSTSRPTCKRYGMCWWRVLEVEGAGKGQDEGRIHLRASRSVAKGLLAAHLVNGDPVVKTSAEADLNDIANGFVTSQMGTSSSAAALQYQLLCQLSGGAPAGPRAAEQKEKPYGVKSRGARIVSPGKRSTVAGLGRGRGARSRARSFDGSCGCTWRRSSPQRKVNDFAVLER